MLFLLLFKVVMLIIILFYVDYFILFIFFFIIKEWLVNMIRYRLIYDCGWILKLN